MYCFEYKKSSDATSPPPIPARIWKIAAATGANITQRIGAVGLVIILAQLGGRNSLDAYTWAFGVLTLISVVTIIFGALIEKYEKKEAGDHAAKAQVV